MATTEAEAMEAVGLALAALDDYETKYDPNQPRDPAGTSTGGQWTDIIASGPTAGVIATSLENVPTHHRDGLTQIALADSGAFLRPNQSKETGWTSGQHDPEARAILLSQNVDNIHVIGGRVAVHEVGHHVHLRKLTADAAAEWDTYSQKGTTARISAYARTNQGEHFAEAYKNYFGTPSMRKRLRATEPAAYSFMQRLNKPGNRWMLADGTQWNGAWRDRYGSMP